MQQRNRVAGRRSRHLPAKLNASENRCCRNPVEKRYGVRGIYYADPGHFGPHKCPAYLDQLRSGQYQIPAAWEGRIYASVTHWQNRDWTDCTRR